MNHPALALGAAVAVAVLVLPVTAAGQESDAEAAVVAANQAWLAAWNARDADELLTAYTSDSIVMAPGAEPIEGHEAVLAYLEDAFAGPGFQKAYEIRELEVFGDTAVEIGSYVLTGDDGAHLDHGQYVVVWRKVDGEWKVSRDIFNSSMPGP